MSDIKEELIRRIEEIGLALGEKNVEFSPITALALAEMAVQVTSICLEISELKARCRVIGAMLELMLQEEGADC